MEIDAAALMMFFCIQTELGRFRDFRGTCQRIEQCIGCPPNAEAQCLEKGQAILTEKVAQCVKASSQ